MRMGLAALAFVAVFAGGCASSPTATPTASSPTTSASARSLTDVASTTTTSEPEAVDADELLTGADQVAADDFAAWTGHRVGLIVHTNSTVNGRHLADLVAESDRVELAALFGPEHGVRGTAGAGELVADDIDPTGVPIHSLYGTTRQPTAEMLEGLDLLVYDLQDVGARWFTYIATMGLAMQAAADQGIPFIVLERPNPLGRTVTPGAVRNADIDSFIAPYPISDLYGLTSAELARAIVGEGWLDGLDELDLRVVTMEGWDPTQRWADLDRPWVAPSPSLTTVESGLLYPATVLFEATTLSIGRGTDAPFTLFGHPDMDVAQIASELEAADLPGVAFRSVEFVAPVDPYEGQIVQAVQIDVVDHRAVDPGPLGVHLLSTVLRVEGDGILDRPDFLDLLAGGPELRMALDEGRAALEIVDARRVEGDAFRLQMEPYLLH